MKKKALACILAAVMVSGIFGGCGSKPAQNKTLKVFYWDDLETSTDLTTQQFKAAVDKFNEADNGYQIEMTTSDISNYYIKLNALVAADDMPDVFMCHPGNLMRNAAESGVLMELDDILKQDGWYDTFNPAYFDSLKYGGKIVGLPVEAASACVFYNKDIFAAAGAEIPSDWQGFLDVCQKIKDAGYAPIATSGTEDWVIGILGGYLSDRNGGSVNAVVDGTLEWTDSSFVDAGNCLLELVDNGYFQDGFLGDSNGQMTTKFITGQAGMMVTGSWAISDINGVESTIADSAGVFPFPAIGGSSDANRWIIKTDNICIDHDTENLDAAVEFLKILTGEEVQKDFAEIAGRLPILQNLDINYEKAPVQLKELSDYMADMTASFGYFNETLSSETGAEFNNAILTIALKQASPEDAFVRVKEVSEEEKAR
jgi:raffinose/stachyose/melibiose transport system substrate-binding protein